MTTSLRVTAASVLLASALALTASAAESEPGHIDFGHITPPSGGGQFVEINVKSSLINMVVRLAEKQQPEVADLLRDLKGVRVNVLGVDDANRKELTKRLSAIREELDAKGWERLVTVQEKNQDVGVYLKQRGEEAIEGIVVTVIDSNKEAVLVNIVGNIRPEKIATLGERLQIEPLKKIGRMVGKS